MQWEGDNSKDNWRRFKQQVELMLTLTSHIHNRRGEMQLFAHLGRSERKGYRLIGAS